MRRVVVSCVLLVGSIMAGCFDQPEPPAPIAATEGPPVASNEPSGGPRSDIEAGAGAGPMPRRVQADATGTTSQGAWFCTDPHGTGGCQGQEISGGAYTVHLEFEDALVGASLNITWEALDATLETMVVVHGVHTENATERFEPFESTSPATIDLTGGSYGTDGMVYIGLWPAAEAKTPLGAAFVDVQRQQFQVAGHLVLAQDA